MEHPVAVLTAFIVAGSVLISWIYVFSRCLRPEFHEPLPPLEERTTSGWMYQDDPPLS